MALAPAYLKVVVEGILFASSLVVGLIFFPGPGVAQPPRLTAIRYLVIQRSANVPTYLLDQPDSAENGRSVVTIGMDVPSGHPVYWTLSIWYAKPDRLGQWRTGPHITVGRPFSVNGGEAVDVEGTIRPGAHSYSEFQGGYLNRSLYHSGHVTDDAQLAFSVSGPVPSVSISGSRLYEGPPGLVDFLYENAPLNVKAERPAPFSAEVLFNAGAFELQGSGPIVTGTPGDMQWDWLNKGTLLPGVAVGVNAGQEQREQEDLFIAAGLFGLAAAALVALILEVINASQRPVEKG